MMWHQDVADVDSGGPTVLEFRCHIQNGGPVSVDLLPAHLAEHGEMKDWLMKQLIYLLYDVDPGEPNV
jgi:hypothetical protein